MQEGERERGKVCARTKVSVSDTVCLHMRHCMRFENARTRMHVRWYGHTTERYTQGRTLQVLTSDLHFPLLRIDGKLFWTLLVHE